MNTSLTKAKTITTTDNLSIIIDIIEYVLPSYFVLYIYLSVQTINIKRKSIENINKASPIA